MKKSIYILAISNLLVGILGTSCKSDADKELTTDDPQLTEEARKHIEEIRKEEEMIDSLNERNIAINDSIEWNVYKKEVKTEIEVNKKLINNLKSGIRNTAKKSDEAIVKNVNQIEKKNADLLAKVDSYTITRENDWEDFKKELEYRLEELDKEIDNIASGKKDK